MGLFSNWKKKAEEKPQSKPAGKVCSVSEALGERKDDIQARKVVELAVELYGKDKITTGSGTTVTIGDLKNKLDRLSMDEFTALNMTMATLASALEDPSGELKAAVDPGLVERMAPVARDVSNKFAEYFIEKMYF